MNSTCKKGVAKIVLLGMEQWYDRSELEMGDAVAAYLIVPDPHADLSLLGKAIFDYEIFGEKVEIRHIENKWLVFETLKGGVRNPRKLLRNRAYRLVKAYRLEKWFQNLLFAAVDEVIVITLTVHNN